MPVIKCISRKSDPAALIKYVLAGHKVEPSQVTKSAAPRYVPGHRLTGLDIHHLLAEHTDAVLQKLLREHSKDGTVQSFIQMLIMQSQARKEAGITLKPILIKHNIRSRSINGYIREFRENEALRQHVRKDSVKAHHTIISFSHLDTKHITEKMLRDIAEKYISLRGPTSLFVGAVHQDRNFYHLHLIQSGTAIGTGLAERISKMRLQEIKRTLQEYQKDKYPELVSLPEHGKSKNSKQKNMEQSKIFKTHERSVREDILLRVIETAFANASSKEEFLAQVRQQGHEPYFRNERLAGIRFNGEDKDKFRLRTFGLSEQELDKLAEKEQLKSIRDLRERDQDRTLNAAKPEGQEKSRLDEFTQAQNEEVSAIQANAVEAELDQHTAWEPELDISDAEEMEREYEENNMEQEDDGIDNDEWGFSRDDDDAYEMDR